MESLDRRRFIKTTAILATISPLGTLASARDHTSLPVFKDNSGLQLALASYTTRAFSLEETIRMSQRVGLKHIGLKSFHLPLDASPEMCRATAEKIKAADLDFYTAGVIYMNKKEEVDQAFNYARACGIKMIVAVPAYELLDYAESMIRQYDIMLAIHNHGPGDEVYPTVPGIYEKISNRDKRLGICMDIGHVVRLDRDPVVDLVQCFDRIMEIHIKDEDKRSAEGNPIEIGRGVINIPAFLREVKKKGYKGKLAFEYEKDEKDPLPGLAESVGYVKGVMDSI